MKDVKLNELKIGDWVVYAVIHNRTARLRFGKITNITKTGFSCHAGSIDRDYRNPEAHKVVILKSSCSYPMWKAMKISKKNVPEEIVTIIEAQEN